MSVELTPNCVPRRRWGKTELSIPVIPYGTQGFGSAFRNVSLDEAFALMQRAVELGINHFDTARCYTGSFEKLGQAIKQGVLKREEIIISSRLCCHSAAPWGGYGEGRPDYSAERAIADIENQLEVLGTTYLDAVFIHDPGEIEPTLAPGGTLDGLRRLKDQGVVHFIGYGMRPHAFHLRAIEEGEIDVLLTFNDYNLLRQSAAEGLLPAAAEKDIGVLNGWSILRGLLTGTPIEKLVPKERITPGSDAERAERIRRWCQEKGIPMIQLALQFCLREERIHGNPIGNSRLEDIETNVRAVLEPLPDEIFEEFQAEGF